MSKPSQTLSAWNKLNSKPLGKWLFSHLVSLKAPYFFSIGGKFKELRPGYCEVHLKKRRKVHNHIGTVHAIAICNLAELVAGTITDATVPADTHRWIPKAMSVEYLAKAETNLHAIAKFDPMPVFEGDFELPVTVNVYDSNDQIVFRALITMWITERKKNSKTVKRLTPGLKFKSD